MSGKAEIVLRGRYVHQFGFAYRCRHTLVYTAGIFLGADWAGSRPLHHSPHWQKQLESTSAHTSVGLGLMWPRWLALIGYQREPSVLWFTLCSEVCVRWKQEDVVCKKEGDEIHVPAWERVQKLIDVTFEWPPFVHIAAQITNISIFFFLWFKIL